MVIASLRGDGDRPVPGAAGRGGHLHDVAVAADARARAPPARRCPAPGRGSGSPRRARPRPRPRAPRPRRPRWSRGSLGSTITSCAPVASIACEDLPGAGPAAGAGLDHLGAGLARKLDQSRAGRDDDQPRPWRSRRCARSRRGRSTCSAKWVTRMRSRRAGLDAGLDRRAHVVDVDVDVPEPLAADHDQGVAERGEPLAQRPGSRRRRRRGGTSPRRPDRPRSGRRSGSGRRGAAWSPSWALRDVATAAGDRRLGGVEDDAQPAASRVDDPGVCEQRQLLGRALERLACGARRRRAMHGRRAGRPASSRRSAAASAAARATVRMVPSTGSPTARRRRRWPAPCPRRTPRPTGRPDRPADPAQQRPDQLAQDHPGVAAGAEQGTAGVGRASPARRSPGRSSSASRHGVAGGLDGEEHVGAGVAVGDRVDVERVDLLARAAAARPPRGRRTGVRRRGRRWRPASSIRCCPPSALRGPVPRLVAAAAWRRSR